MATPNIREASETIVHSKTKSMYFRYKYVYGDLSVFDPVITVLSDYKSYIIANSEVSTLDQKYYQRPDLLSYDIYGSPEFWYVLLFINDIPSVIDFVKTTIFVPSSFLLQQMIRDYIPDNKRTILYDALKKVSDSKTEVLNN